MKQSHLLILCCFPLCLACFMPRYVIAQADKRLDVTFGLSTLNPLSMALNYDIFQFPGSGFGSKGAPVLEWQVNYAQQFHPRFWWLLGAAMGRHGYHMSIALAENFSREDVGAFYDYYTGLELKYAAARAGLQYDLPVSRTSMITLHVGGRFSYPLPSTTAINAQVYVDNNARIRNVFMMEATWNEEETIIFSSDWGLYYRYNFKDNKTGLSLGLNAVLSRSRPMNGSFIIIGERETLTGTFQKEFMHFGALLGIYRKL